MAIKRYFFPLMPSRRLLHQDFRSVECGNQTLLQVAPCDVIYDVMYVLDTNVIVAALISRRGASHWLLERALDGRVQIAVSVALALEYEDVLSRSRLKELSWATTRQIDQVLDGLLACAKLVTPIQFKLRPILNDPGDDLVLECAVQAGVQAIITVNLRDFAPVKNLYDIAVLKPGDLVAELRRKGME